MLSFGVALGGHEIQNLFFHAVADVGDVVCFFFHDFEVFLDLLNFFLRLPPPFVDFGYLFGVIVPVNT